MGAPTEVVQPASVSGRTRSRCVALPREQRGWREVPRMRRSGRTGIRQPALAPYAVAQVRDARALDDRDRSLERGRPRGEPSEERRPAAQQERDEVDPDL